MEFYICLCHVSVCTDVDLPFIHHSHQLFFDIPRAINTSQKKFEESRDEDSS